MPDRPFPTRKISESLIDFAEPFLAHVDSTTPQETIGPGFELAATIWNAFVMDRANGNSNYETMKRKQLGAHWECQSTDPSPRRSPETPLRRRHEVDRRAPRPLRCGRLQTLGRRQGPTRLSGLTHGEGTPVDAPARASRAGLNHFAALRHAAKQAAKKG